MISSMIEPDRPLAAGEPPRTLEPNGRSGRSRANAGERAIYAP
jgi:hypothetical protein